MNIIFSTLIAIIIILLFASLSALLYGIWRKDNEKFIQKTADRVSSLIRSDIVLATDLQKPGPWYLLVFTKDRSCPIWVSNNNIRSIHPDSLNHKVIVKQFNGEDIVIENVENFRWRSASEMC